MAGKPGALVVLNVASGKILAKSHPEVAAQRLAAPGSTLKPFVLAIAYSCNSYFASVATLLKHDELARMLRRTGFTSQTHLVPNEAVGTLTEAREEPQLQLQALGEWGIEVTPLELLMAYRNLALQKLRTPDTGSAAPVFDGLERSVRYGMAHAAQPRNNLDAWILRGLRARR